VHTALGMRSFSHQSFCQPALRWSGVRLRSTFLLADPDRQAQTELRAFFAQRGLRPLVTAEGTAVIRLLTECHDGKPEGECPIDLVIAAVDLPGRSGMDILRVVRENGWPAQVVLTASEHDARLREEVLRLGAAAFLVKPFSQVHLRRLFHRLVTGLSNDAAVALR
jgi:DNA-binding response OmpR family regulator